MDLRNKLDEELVQYVSDTFSYIQTVKEFNSSSSEWIETREAEINTMATIQETLKKMNLSIFSVIVSEKKGEGFKKFLNNMIPGRAEKEEAKLQEELVKSLDQTQLGLKELKVFLEAVEHLAVTSVHVFDQNQVLQLSDRADLESVQEIIFVAQLFCPLLLSFKQDHEVFFSPKIQNIEVMMFQLEQYIRNVKQICGAFRKSSLTDLCLDRPLVDRKGDVSEEDIEKMILLINNLQKIRMEEHFRTLFLFQDQYQTFLEKFSDLKDGMETFLKDLEPCAVQLDKMNKGARISSVVGSSVGVVSGTLSIIGLALIPVTAGASIGLIGAGAGLAALSAFNSLVTTATEIGVNSAQKEKANNCFQNFKKDVNVLQNCLNEVINNHFKIIQENPLQSFMMSKTGVTIFKCIDTVMDCVSAAATKGTTVSNVSRAASEIPELGQAAVKGPLAMSKAARGGLFVLNALFIGVDVGIIVSSSLSLAKGCETEFSKWIRARAALWRSEIDSWQKICDSLEKSQTDSEKKQEILKVPFYS